ncbi:MAG TPA: ATP-binding protein [Streptosporangiaceae bacterium]
MPNAAYRARRHTEELLRYWRLGRDETFVYRVKLVVSELVTNAANATVLLAEDERRRHDRCPAARCSLDMAALGQVRLRLSSDARSHLLIEVGDRSGDPPVPQTPGIDAEGGRGLLLVETLCDGWGWYPTDGTESTAVQDHTSRKVVWGRLRLDPRGCRHHA